MRFAAQVVSDQCEGILEVRAGYFSSQLPSEPLNIFLDPRVLDRRGSLADIFRELRAESGFFVILRSRSYCNDQNEDRSRHVSPSSSPTATLECSDACRLPLPCGEACETPSERHWLWPARPPAR